MARAKGDHLSSPCVSVTQMWKDALLPISTEDKGQQRHPSMKWLLRTYAYERLQQESQLRRSDKAKYCSVAYM